MPKATMRYTPKMRRTTKNREKFRLVQENSALTVLTKNPHISLIDPIKDWPMLGHVSGLTY